MRVKKVPPRGSNGESPSLHLPAPSRREQPATVLCLASKTSGVIGTINKVDAVVYMGEASDGFLYVQGADVEGWVQEVMVR